MKRLFLKMMHAIIYLFYICLFYLLFLFSNLFFIKKKIWIISERGYDARDNGLFFFEYVANKHPEVNCYYAIHKKSPDYKNVSKYKKVLEFGSFRHIFLFSCARAKISSTVNGFAPNKYYAKYMLKHHLQGKNIGLKHGIFKNIHPNYFKTNSHLDLIICGAQPEYKFVKDNFGFKDDEVAYCGLARFDNLHNTTPKKQILIMPTFRIPLSNCSDTEFVETDYYKKWSEYLNKLDKIVSENLTVIFYIHAVFQKYAHLFENKYKNIIVAKFADYEVQKLLIDSCLLITDFSSVFFDFAYMHKPVIFYQFDEDYYFKEHYQKGYFDYRENGFGDVCVSESEAIASAVEILKREFHIDPFYENRINKFFVLNDEYNCERIFERIKSIV